LLYPKDIKSPSPTLTYVDFEKPDVILGLFLQSLNFKVLEIYSTGQTDSTLMKLS
jgi:hypothetical protein